MNIKKLKNWSFYGMVAIPFGLYFAALNDAEIAVYGLLGLMALCMFITMKKG